MKQIIGLLLIAIPVASALIGWIVTTAMKHGIVVVAVGLLMMICIALGAWLLYEDY